ncbi:MAG TPA: hypothetical protein VF551_05900, partial [Chthoniobacterales bacterium]
MGEEIVIISPELQRGAGGLADYTLRVVEEWGGRWPLRFVVPEPAGASDLAEGNVETIAPRADALRNVLPRTGGRVFLQYSAYGYDAWGYPRWLLHELVNWKQRSGGLLVVMLHEIWTMWPRLNKNYLVQQLHRRDLRKLVACADATFTSTPSQAELVASNSRRAVQVLPVGSNIRVSADVANARETGTAVLFGLHGSRIRTLRQMHDQLKELAAARVLTRIITVGEGSGRDQDEERTLLAALNLPTGYEQRGA